MNDTLVSIGADGIDVEKIVQTVRDTVADKMARGLYTDPRVARAERMNLGHLRNDEEFLSFYLDCLRDAVFVDINDFEIIEKRARLSRLLVALKRAIWSLLKFYTYRLWSQQNQVNGLLLSSVEATENRYRAKVRELEDRVAKLEAAAAPPGAR
jgi:hypothetical protein